MIEPKQWRTLYISGRGFQEGKYRLIYHETEDGRKLNTTYYKTRIELIQSVMKVPHLRRHLVDFSKDDGEDLEKMILREILVKRRLVKP